MKFKKGGGSTSPEWWVNLKRNGGSTCSGIYIIAHEMTHCLQFDKLGFWESKPIANIPNWKWEGYAEYISRQNADQKDLSKNIQRFIATDKKIGKLNLLTVQLHQENITTTGL